MDNTDRSYAPDEDGKPVWACEAYGEDGLRLGALCFFSSYEYHRGCKSLSQCKLNMYNERRRVWKLIQAKASEGDEMAGFLAAAFPTPEGLLNASAARLVERELLGDESEKSWWARNGGTPIPEE